MTTGTTSTTVTANWTVTKDANGHPTAVSGDDVKVFVSSSPPFSGQAWSDIDTMDAIPDGATITDLTFSLGVQLDGPRDNPANPDSPSIDFVDKADFLSGSWFAIGNFVNFGVGALPDDNDPHDIAYVNSVYRVASGGGGFFDSDVIALAAALSNPTTPVVVVVAGPNGGASGTGITYTAPLTITFAWEAPDPDVDLPCDEWVNLDLSTAVFLDNNGTLSGQYVDGVICTTDDNLYPDFYFPSLTLDPAKPYQIAVTYDPDSDHDSGDGAPSREVYVAGLRPGHEQDDVDAAYTAGGEWSGAVAVFYDTNTTVTGHVQIFTIGPGRSQGSGLPDLPTWDDATLGVAAGYTAPWFETGVSGAVSAISIRKLCTTFAPPLRQYPRNDGLGASSARRLYPPPPTIQASNRRGPTAIL